MKRTLLLILLLTGAIAAHSQTDSANIVVDNYLRLLNFEGLRTDSTLYIESRIFTPGMGDTLVMKRWHQAPNLDRLEMWPGCKLAMGCFFNGKGVCQKYNAQRRKWALINYESFLNLQTPYDFRGPLYHYRMQGAELTYMGLMRYEGQECHRVLVKMPGHYDRYYLFECRTKLLFLIDELPTHHEDHKMSAKPVEWRAVHEYQPFGESLLPSLESYLHEEGHTVISHTYRYIAYDPALFN